MSIRRYANPDQFTLKHRDLQTVPEGESRIFDFNGIKVHKGLGLCCDDTKENPCAYDATPTNLTGVTAIIFKDANGVNKEVTFVASTSARDLKNKLAEALINDGADPNYNGDDYRGISIKGAVVRFIGTVEIVSLKTGATVHAAVKKCNTVPDYETIFSYPVETPFVGINGNGVGGTTFTALQTAGLITYVGTQLTAAGITALAPTTAVVIGSNFVVTTRTNETYKAGATEAPYSFVGQTWVA